MEETKKKRGTKLYWTPERILEIAKTCSSKTELQKKNAACYQRAKKTGQIETFEWFRQAKEPRKPRGYYTKERCAEVAAKFTKLKEFRRQAYSCYMICMMRGWLKDFPWLEKDMKHNRHLN
jgi:hypothetical protein